VHDAALASTAQAFNRPVENVISPISQRGGSSSAEAGDRVVEMALGQDLLPFPLIFFRGEG